MTTIIKSKPANEQIADLLRKEIAAKYKVGDILPSARALCQRFGVSPTTVNTALDNLEREGFVERRHGSGTFVADASLRASGDNEKHIAVLIDKDISHPQLSYSHVRVSEVLLDFFKQRNMSVKRYTGKKAPWESEGEPTCPDFLAAVEDNRISAVVLLATHSHPSWSSALQNKDVPVIGEFGSDTEVMPDYALMKREAVDYLYNNGRTNIALMEWYDQQTIAHHEHDIGQAFKERMDEIGLPVKNEWVRQDIPAVSLGAGWEGFREIWSAPLNEKPDGLIIMDDILFRDAITAICQINIDVPEDLMIVTHANKGSGIFSPLPVVKMENDPDEKACTLGELTIRILAGQSIDGISLITNYHLIDCGQDNTAVDSVNSFSLSDFSERKVCYEMV